MSTKEVQEKIIDNMRRWQKIENATVTSTESVINSTKNPLIQLVMEIIQSDSQMHYRVQDLIASSLEIKAITLDPEELAEVWGKIENHLKLEKQTVKMATETKEALKGKKMVVQEYLIDYLLADEQKHNTLLENLETIKKGMYPYG